MKLHSTAAALIALIVALPASAEILKKDCSTQQYQKVVAVVGSASIPAVQGAELRASVDSLLLEEMAPRCQSVIDTDALFGVPETSVASYEISSGSRSYSVLIATNKMDSSIAWVALKKLSQ